jgi:hypothetical protein
MTEQKLHLPIFTEPTLDELMPQTTPAVKKIEKDYISYSEWAKWMGCSWAHKLHYIDKIKLDGASVHTEYGKTIHWGLEHYAKTKEIVSDKALREDLTKRFLLVPGASEEKESKWHDQLTPSLLETIEVFNREFPDWELIQAEMELSEPIENHARKFQGFVDIVFATTGKRGKKEVWLADWKTTTKPWWSQQKQDKVKQAQLVFYKHFVATKLGLDLTDVKIAFITIAREPGKGKSRIEIIPVSAGPVTIRKALEDLDFCLGSVEKGYYRKNRNSCKYCKYKDTEHCT